MGEAKASSDKAVDADSARRTLAQLLRPRSIAFIGGREAEVALAASISLGFDGTLHAVSARRRSMVGIDCVASVHALEVAPDAAFVAVPPEAAVDVVAALAERGAGGAVVYTAGFAEVGDAGRARQAALVEAAGEMPLIGPNCYGTLNFFDGAGLWPDAFGSWTGVAPERGVALVSQSGNLAMTATMQRRELRLGALASIGNAANRGVADLVDAYVDDPRVSAIGLLVESIDDPHALGAACARARNREERVPIVALKLGRSALGGALALGHTASLAGEADVHDALCARLGIGQVRSLAAFVETLKLLDVAGAPRGRRFVSLSCSGGEAELVADGAAERALEPAVFDAARAKSLGKLAGLDYRVRNPFDYHTYIWGDSVRLEACFSEAFAADTDSACLLLDFPVGNNVDASAWHVAVDAVAVAAASARERGVACALVSVLPEALPDAVCKHLTELGVAPLQGLDTALDALAAGADIGAAWRDTAPAPLARTPGACDPTVLLDEVVAKQWLSGQGVAIPRGQPCTREGLHAAVRDVGFPLVLKGLVEGAAHKSELGVVHVGLRDEPALVEALQAMPAHCERLLVEAQVQPAVVELLVAMRSDPSGVLVMVVGAGGIDTELHADARTLTLPATREQLSAALASLRLAPHLAGYRGAPGTDLDAVLDTLERLAAIGVNHADRLVELEINPLIVTPRGAVCADAVLRLRG